MGLTDGLTMAIEGIMAIFIFSIFFTALLPSIIDTINNGTGVGMPEATILIVSLILIVFVVGIVMRLYKNITQPDQPQMGGY